MKNSLIVVLWLLVMPIWTAAQTSPPANLSDLVEAQLELQRITLARADERIRLLADFLQKPSSAPLAGAARELMLRARAALAETELKQQRPELAVEQFQKAFQEAAQPVNDRIFLNYIWAFPVTLLGHGYREEAILLMRRFEPSYWQQSARLVQIGLFYLNAEAGEDATRVFTRAIQLDPQQHKYHSSLANAYLIRLRLEEAIAAWQRAITLEPKEPVAYAGLAALYRAEGAYEDAVSLYQKQLEVAPDHESAHGGLAITYLLTKDDTRAAEELAKQFAITPRDYRLFTQLAYLAASQGDYGMSRRWAGLALSIAPTYSWARIVMANVLVAEQDYASAEELLSDALARSPGFPTLYFELTKLLLLAEDYIGAYEQFEKFLSITTTGEFEARLGGLLSARSRSFKLLLEKEHKAALGMPQSLTSDRHYQLVENFLRFEYYLNKTSDKAQTTDSPTNSIAEQPPQENELRTLEALGLLLAVEDERRPFRQLWAAERLLANGVALGRATTLVLEALKVAEAATRLEGSLRDALELNREARLRLFRARGQHLLGRIYFKQGQLEEANKALRLSIESYEVGAEQRTALSQLAAVQQAAGHEAEALDLYIKGFNRYDENASLQRTLIENLYRKLHGSLAGLDLK
ncbi:MAG: tetratricopeptide repeat protein [Acidobacteriota bacterium]